MGIFSLKSKTEMTAAIVSDLDALVAEPIAFKLHGKIFTINPISTLELLKFTNAFAKIQAINTKSEPITVAELVDAYLEVISSVCPEIERRDIEAMTQAQISALFQLVMDSVVGKAHAQPDVESGEGSKKKHLT
jgi:hypothetical protein